jgi:hypothetical protein
MPEIKDELFKAIALLSGSLAQPLRRPIHYDDQVYKVQVVKVVAARRLRVLKQ